MRKNLLIIIPNLGRGGAQQVFHQQLNHLPTHANTFGCVFNWDGSFPSDQMHNIFSLDVPAGRSMFGKAYYFILRIVRLNKLKKEKQIDVSISHLEGADYVNILSRGKDKVICWVHGTKVHDENIDGLLGRVRMNILIPWLYKRANRIVTVSNGIATELVSRVEGIRDITQTIFNGFDVNQITALSNEVLEPEFVQLFNQSPAMITHCRLSRQKNLHAMLTIFSTLVKRNRVKLIILGDGELREELLKTCEALALKSWTCWDSQTLRFDCDVYFMGQQQNPFKFLRHASMYIMTSGWEGFPLALCEAMACRLPILASDCFTGPREIMAPENKSPQPLQSPYATRYGALMPLADLSNQQAINTWVQEAEGWLIKINSPDFSKPDGGERIRQFDLSESIDQTFNLVCELTA